MVVHSPRHVRRFAELTDTEVAAVAAAWQARRDAARAEGFAYLHALVNEGRAAGSSLPHSHSQLVWLRERPPAVVAERLDALPELVGDRSLRVGERDGVVALAHPAGRMPYETLIAGRPFSLEPALLLLQDVVARVQELEGPVAWNAWLHEEHLEVVPRLTTPAGVELGAGISVNTLAPEDAARALRSLPPRAP